MNNYDGYTESPERTAARKARMLKSVKPVCICLQYIGDNGDCPVHGKGFENKPVEKKTDQRVETMAIDYYGMGHDGNW